MNLSFPYKAIVAVSQNGVIGKNGDLPWRLPGDLKWFKKITIGHTVLMGRKTWESLPFPLPGRKNWVLSRTAKPQKGMEVVRSSDEIADKLQPGEQLFVIGGGEVYSQYLARCNEIYVTEVLQTIQGGDAFFPDFKSDFTAVETLDENKDFILKRWRRTNQ
jgi:dihydrofolate reductase